MADPAQNASHAAQVAAERFDSIEPEHGDARFRDHRGRVAPPPLFSCAGTPREPGPWLPVADTHTHLDCLSDPAYAIAQCAALGVSFLVDVTDPTDGGPAVYRDIEGWFSQAGELLESWGLDVPLPGYRIAVGIHPHNAKDATKASEQELIRLAADPRTCAIGEIGLDYHYDFSPRDLQRDVFARQIGLANRMGLPISMHLREAHDDAIAILKREGVPRAGAVVHCFNLGTDVLEPFLELGCHIALGGPLTFVRGDETREAVRHVPTRLLLTETDAPYMAPVPLRGTECLPAMVLYTARGLLDAIGVTSDDEQIACRWFFDNAHALLGREPTAWQLDETLQSALMQEAEGCVSTAESERLDRECAVRKAARESVERAEAAERKRVKDARRAAQDAAIAAKARARMERALGGEAAGSDG